MSDVEEENRPSLIHASMRRGAVMSACASYRFTLTRRWDDRPALVVVMFNPSHAGAEVDDQTITLVCHIASHNGYGGIVVVNLCPLRSPHPEDAFVMLDQAQIGGDLKLRAIMWKNFEAIDDAIRSAGAVLVAWGAMGFRAGDWLDTMRQTLRDVSQRTPVYQLGTCANGHPKHPLARGKHRVPKTAPLLPWRP